MESEIQSENHIVVFSDHNIRRTFHNNEWWFSITDVIGSLTESANARRKRQLIEKEGHSELFEKIVQLKLPSSDGKSYKTDCANTELLFRIIQSIPSPRQNLLNAG